MIPLPQNKIGNTRKLFKKAIKRMKVVGRIKAKSAVERLENGYNARIMDAYVDDVDKPTRMIVFSRMPAVVTDELLAIVQFIWAPPKDRKDEKVQNEFKEQIDAYALLFKHHSLVASSWVFRGSKASDAFWKNQGFELQERVWVKFPNKENQADEAMRPSSVMKGIDT